MAQLAEELKGVDPQALRVIQRDLQSGQVKDVEEFKNAVRQLPPSAQLQLKKDLEQQHKMSARKKEDEREFMQDMMESGTLTGEAKKLGRAVLKGAIEVGEFIDKFTGAPTRAGIAAAQEGRFADVIPTMAGQVLEDPSKAPTGKQLMQRVGFSEEETIPFPFLGRVSPAGMAGVAADVLFDWTNIIPIGAIAKAGKAAKAKGGKAVGELAVDGSKAALRKAEEFTPTARATKILKSNFTAKQAPDFEELKLIARELGIDENILPPAAEFGKESVITRALRGKGEGPLGERLLRNHDKVIRQANVALSDAIADIAKGPIMTREEAGIAIKEYFSEAMSRTFDDLEFNNGKLGKVIKQRLGATNMKLSSIIPEKRMQKWEKLKQSKLNELERIIAESPSPARVSEAKLTKDALNKVNPKLEINRFISQMQTIGDEAFGKKPVVFGEAGPDYKMLQDLYFDSRELLLDGAAQVLDKETLTDIVVQNKMVQEFFENSAPIRKTILNKELPPEKLFNSLIENIDSRKKAGMEALFTPDQMDALKGAYLETIAKKATNKDDLLSFASFKKQLTKSDKAGFILDQKDIDRFEKILRFGDRMGIPILSTSGTSAGLKLRDIPRNVAAQLADDVIIDSLIRMSRGEKDVISKAVEGGGKELLDELKGISLRRGPKELGSKGLQTISVQSQDPENPITRALRIRR